MHAEHANTRATGALSLFTTIYTCQCQRERVTSPQLGSRRVNCFYCDATPSLHRRHAARARLRASSLLAHAYAVRVRTSRRLSAPQNSRDPVPSAASRFGWPSNPLYTHACWLLSSTKLSLRLTCESIVAYLQHSKNCRSAPQLMLLEARLMRCITLFLLRLTPTAVQPSSSIL